MEHYKIPIDFNGRVESDSYEYNLEPFHHMNYSAEYKSKFHEECEKIFEVIGKEHIPKILAYFYEYSRFRKKMKVKKIQILRERGLFLLDLMNSEKFFSPKTTLKKLEKLFDESEIDAGAWEIGFNIKRHNEKSLLKLKEVLWRGHSFKIKLENEKYIFLHPKIKILLNHPMKGYTSLEQEEVLTSLLTVIVNNKLEKHKDQQTKFYTTLLDFSCPDRFIYMLPDCKKLKQSLGAKNFDGLFDYSTYLLIQEVNLYLDDYTILKEGLPGFGSKTNAISKSKKSFFFNLLLLIGLIKAPNSNLFTPYTSWDDYLERKKQYNEAKKGGKNGLVSVEINAIDDILRHKCK